MASNRLSTFAPNKVTIVLTQESTGLSHILSGFSEDSIVQIERNVETFAMYTGADDTSTRIFNANTSAKITVALAQTSESNDILSALHNNDKDSLDGLFSIMVKDTSGRSYYFAEEAYVAVIPNSNFANSMQLREWVIHAAQLDHVIGGNARFTPDGLATMTALGVTVDERWT